MHVISKKNLNSAELETLTTSRSPTIVITANGEVQTHEEATVYVKELKKLYARLHECSCEHCSGYGAVRAELPLQVSSVRVLLCLGSCGVSRSEVTRLPTLRGGPPQRLTRHTCRPPGHPCKRGPEHWALSPSHSVDRVGSGLSIHARASPEVLPTGINPRALWQRESSQRSSTSAKKALTFGSHGGH